jgi:hypothetical protein
MTSDKAASPARLLQEMEKLGQHGKQGGDLAPFKDQQQWERMVASSSPQLRPLLIELVRFADLWKYFEQREEKLGGDIVDGVSALHELPLARRVLRLKTINRRLMRRIADAGERSELRQ